MADDDDVLDRDTAMAALERCRLRGVAFIAEHYVPATEPMTDEEFVGSMSDPEHVWHLSMDDALGTWERWEAFSAAVAAGKVMDEDEVADEDFMEKVAETLEAYTAVMCLATDESLRLRHERRLFDHVTPARPNSRAWAAMVALEVDPEERAISPWLFGRGAVATYLYNMEGGVMDATGAFLDFEDAE